MQFVIEVDRSDNPLGLVEKQEAHQKGILHRAFSVFLFRHRGPFLEVLLQQRALCKYHSGGLWTNTCCSHAEDGIPTSTTALQRLKSEMGITCELKPAGSFYYHAELDSGMIEHEIDHVFFAFSDPIVIEPDPQEVQNYLWEDVDALVALSKERQREFTAWFPKALELALQAAKV